jgi:CRISPR-associated protein Cas1
LESGRFGKKDFYRMDNYVLRLRPGALRKFIDALRIKFNSPVRHVGKLYGWDTVIVRKCQELARYLLGKSTTFDLTSPRPVMERSNTHELREKILALSQSEARKLGIGKSTLHYLRENARSSRSFRVYRKIRRKLQRGDRR